MSATAVHAAAPAVRKPDPREALDPAKQTELLMLLAQGCSRRLAASRVGCTHTTIARTIERYPHFAVQVAQAEALVDMSAIRRVHEAAQESKYWRAAAWVLERRRPEEFAPRPGHTFSCEQVVALLNEVFAYALPALKDEEKEAFMRRFEGTIEEVEAVIAQADRWRNCPTQGGSKEQGVEATTVEKSIQQSSVAESAAAEPSPADALRKELAAESPTTTADSSPEPSNGRDVCQVSPASQHPSVNRVQRNFRQHNDLRRQNGSVPGRKKPRGGEENGHLAHSGNGKS